MPKGGPKVQNTDFYPFRLVKFVEFVENWYNFGTKLVKFINLVRNNIRGGRKCSKLNQMLPKTESDLPYPFN